MESRVTLKIYNALGKEVATLVDEVQGAGERRTRFDGSGLPSGIYIYQLRVGRYADAKKMIVLR